MKFALQIDSATLGRRLVDSPAIVCFYIVI